MEEKKSKKWMGYIWNGLFLLVILILLIPSWRIKFQSTIQRLFITSVKLEDKASEAINIAPNEWVIYDINNEPISFHELGNKPIILNFWATWCPSCIAELPSLYEFYDAIKNDAHVIAVSTESIKQLDEFGAFDKYPGMIYRAKHTIAKFDFSVYPTTFIMGPDFRIISKIEGAENFATEHNINFIKQLK
ncbi:MAG: TlpA family protein disulfide reductase [Crocinitomicaceae bacterium]